MKSKNECKGTVELRYYSKKDKKVYTDVENISTYENPLDIIQTFQGNMYCAHEDLSNYVVLSVKFNYENEKDIIHNNSLMTTEECYEILKDMLHSVYVSEDVISCVEDISGKTIENLKKILFWKTGLRDFEDLDFYDEKVFREIRRFPKRLILINRTQSVKCLCMKDLMKDCGDREREIVENATTWLTIGEKRIKLIDVENNKFAIWDFESKKWVG